MVEPGEDWLQSEVAAVRSGGSGEDLFGTIHDGWKAPGSEIGSEFPRGKLRGSARNSESFLGADDEFSAQF